MIQKLVGKDVTVRSNMSGVWMGRLEAVEVMGSALYAIQLSDAHKVHQWQGAAATSGLAIRGPGDGSRICEPVELALVGDANEVLVTTASAMKRLRALKKWAAE